jgi:hypothetical protein
MGFIFYRPHPIENDPLEKLGRPNSPGQSLVAGAKNRLPAGNPFRRMPLVPDTANDIRRVVPERKIM